DGQTVTRDLVERLIDEEMHKIEQSVGDEAFGKGRWDDAHSLFSDMALTADFADFLTLPAYEQMP
ncbi:MAG: malate synthase A, partial [Nocardioidaceae bacterium]|nr:malate synthase A [Nocardioidaceae bacterium]